MQEQGKSKYNKEELIMALIKAPTYHQQPSKEEILDEIWEMLLKRASKRDTLVVYRLGMCSSFGLTPAEEQVDKLYFFIRTELEKIGHFLFHFNPDGLFHADLTIEWDRYSL